MGNRQGRRSASAGLRWRRGLHDHMSVSDAAGAIMVRSANTAPFRTNSTPVHISGSSGTGATYVPFNAQCFKPALHCLSVPYHHEHMTALRAMGIQIETELLFGERRRYGNHVCRCVQVKHLSNPARTMVGCVLSNVTTATIASWKSRCGRSVRCMRSRHVRPIVGQISRWLARPLDQPRHIAAHRVASIFLLPRPTQHNRNR